MEKIEHQIGGVLALILEEHSDDRGSLTEIHRNSWDDQLDIVQWNMVLSKAKTLRGVHVHSVHVDYLLVTTGTMHLGLRDLRRGSPTVGVHDIVVLKADEPTVWVIPPGVAHGFYFPERASHIYGVSDYWDKNDEMACRWDEAELGFTLCSGEPLLSPRDADAGTLEEMTNAYHAACSSVVDSNA